MNLVRTHLLGPAIVVVRSRMNTSRNVFFCIPGVLRSVIVEEPEWKRSIAAVAVSTCIRRV